MKRVELQVANTEITSMRVVLEPWCHEVCLAPGELLSLSLESEAQGETKFVFGEGSLTVFAWPGCRLRFEVNGEPQVEYPDCPDW
jgi:hypothetical protein